MLNGPLIEKTLGNNEVVYPTEGADLDMPQGGLGIDFDHRIKIRLGRVGISHESCRFDGISGISPLRGPELAFLVAPGARGSTAGLVASDLRLRITASRSIM